MVVVCICDRALRPDATVKDPAMTSTALPTAATVPVVSRRADRVL